MTRSACIRKGIRDHYLIAKRPALAPHLAHLERCAALRIVLVTVLRATHSCEHFTDGFDLLLLRKGVNALNCRPESEGRKIDVRLPGKGNSKSHGARPVY